MTLKVAEMAKTFKVMDVAEICRVAKVAVAVTFKVTVAGLTAVEFLMKATLTRKRLGPSDVGDQDGGGGGNGGGGGEDGDGKAKDGGSGVGSSQPRLRHRCIYYHFVSAAVSSLRSVRLSLNSSHVLKCRLLKKIGSGSDSSSDKGNGRDSGSGGGSGVGSRCGSGSGGDSGSNRNSDGGSHPENEVWTAPTMRRHKWPEPVKRFSQGR